MPPKSLKSPKSPNSPSHPGKSTAKNVPEGPKERQAPPAHVLVRGLISSFQNALLLREIRVWSHQVDEGIEDLAQRDMDAPAPRTPKAEIPVPRDEAGWQIFQEQFQCSSEMMKELEDTFKLLGTDGSGALEEQEGFDGLAALGTHQLP